MHLKRWAALAEMNQGKTMHPKSELAEMKQGETMHQKRRTWLEQRGMEQMGSQEYQT
jgi:gluconate kinase